MKLLTVADLCERWQFKDTRTVQELLTKYCDILQPAKIAGTWRVNPKNVERFEELMVPGAMEKKQATEPKG